MYKVLCTWSNLGYPEEWWDRIPWVRVGKVEQGAGHPHVPHHHSQQCRNMEKGILRLFAEIWRKVKTWIVCFIHFIKCELLCSVLHIHIWEMAWHIAFDFLYVVFNLLVCCERLCGMEGLSLPLPWVSKLGRKKEEGEAGRREGRELLSLCCWV